MKSWLPTILVIAVLATGGVLLINNWTPMHGQAYACGNWGASGGGDYSPRQRGYSRNAPANTGAVVSADRARDILSGHLARLNPGLTVGDPSDAGTHYEFEVRSGSETVERLGVDKSTGLVRPLN